MTDAIANSNAIQIQYLQDLAGASGVDTEQKAFAQGILAGIQGMPEAEQAEILSVIFGIAPGSDLAADEMRAQMDAALVVYDAVAEALSNNTTIGSNSAYMTADDAAKLLAELAVEHGGEQRKNTRLLGIAARDARVAFQLNIADEKTELAKDIKATATKALIVGIVGGAVSMAGGAAGMYGGAKSAGLAPSQITSKMAMASNSVHVGQGGSQMAQAGKGAYDAEMQADQAEVGAIEAELGAASELESSNDRITEEVAQALKDFIQAVIASLHDAQKAEANRRWFA